MLILDFMLLYDYNNIRYFTFVQYVINHNFKYFFPVFFTVRAVRLPIKAVQKIQKGIPYGRLYIWKYI